MRELSNATSRLPDGRIWAKDSWCSYEQPSRVHGASGDRVGLWVLIPKDESGYNLPSNHPGTVHDGSSVVMVTHQEGVPHNMGSEQRVSLGVVGNGETLRSKMHCSKAVRNLRAEVHAEARRSTNFCGNGRSISTLRVFLWCPRLT